MRFPVAERTAALIRALPKTETHLHIEGSLPFELLHRIRPDLYPEPPDSWAQDFRFPDFRTFEKGLLAMAGHWFTSPDRYHEAASVLFTRLRDEHNVRYIETSFASGMMEFGGMDGRATAEAIRTAAPEGVEVRVLMGIHHVGYHEGTKDWIDASLHWPHLDGIDLHGPETAPVGPWAADLWARARAQGLITKAHAGEFDGPAFVGRVVDELGVRRVQHGVRAIEDPELLHRLAELDVTFDVCPVSNVKLGVVSSYDAHPIGRLMDAGIRCTVSTDDPLVFGSTLQDEYELLASRLGFDDERLARIARAGFEVASVDPAWREDRLAEIDDLLDARAEAA